MGRGANAARENVGACRQATTVAHSGGCCPVLGGRSPPDSKWRDNVRVRWLDWRALGSITTLLHQEIKQTKPSSSCGLTLTDTQRTHCRRIGHKLMLNCCSRFCLQRLGKHSYKHFSPEAFLLSYECKPNVADECRVSLLLFLKFLGFNLSLFSSTTYTESQYCKRSGKIIVCSPEQPDGLWGTFSLLFNMY